MTATILTQQTRPWTRRVRRAIPYGPFARLGDWWAARRDAQVVLPALLLPPVGATGGPAETAEREGAGWETPRTVFLGQLGRGRAEKEWLHYRRDVADWLVALADAQASLDAAQRELQTAEKSLAELSEPHELSDSELNARRSGEQGTDPEVIKARRRQDHAGRRKGAESRVQQLNGRVAEHEATVARFSEPVRLRFEVARTRADLIDAYVRRRCAYYLARLIRRHAEAGQIRPLVRSDWPERPAWTTQAMSPDLAKFAAVGGGTGPSQTGDER